MQFGFTNPTQNWITSGVNWHSSQWQLFFSTSKLLNFLILKLFTLRDEPSPAFVARTPAPTPKERAKILDFIRSQRVKGRKGAPRPLRVIISSTSGFEAILFIIYSSLLLNNVIHILKG